MENFLKTILKLTIETETTLNELLNIEFCWQLGGHLKKNQC